MIKLNQVTRTVRECTAPFEYNDPKTGDPTVEEIRVRYFAQTTAELKQLRSDLLAKSAAAEADPKTAEFPWLSGQLVDRLESLPDIVDDKGKPIAITIETLDQIPAVNLRAIYDSIEADAVPRPLPAK